VRCRLPLLAVVRGRCCTFLLYAEPLMVFKSLRDSWCVMVATCVVGVWVRIAKQDHPASDLPGPVGSELRITGVNGRVIKLVRRTAAQDRGTRGEGARD
jgi:hypothetical protein